MTICSLTLSNTILPLLGHPSGGCESAGLSMLASCSSFPYWQMRATDVNLNKNSQFTGFSFRDFLRSFRDGILLLTLLFSRGKMWNNRGANKRNLSRLQCKYLALNSDASLVRYGRLVEAWKMLAKTMPATAGDVWSLKATQATAVVMTQMTPRTSQRRVNHRLE